MIAVNVLLDPDDAAVERAQAVNARLLEDHPSGFALDADHAPHVSVLHRFIRTADLDDMAQTLATVLSTAPPMDWGSTEERPAPRTGTGSSSTTPEPVMEPAMFASILPAVWSFQLALRSRGLGSTLTTAHQFEQPRVAEILGIPSTWFQVALLPVAYTIGTDFTPSRRKPVEDVIAWNRSWTD